MKTNRKITTLLASLLAIFALYGCDDDDGASMLTGPDMGEGVMLRVVHAAPDAGLVDVYAEASPSLC